MEKIGVIGAGVMGSGVAQNFAQNGFYITLVDVSQPILEKAKENIHNNVRFHALFNKQSIVEDEQSIMSRITFTTDYNLLENMDVYIENVTEDWEIKKNVYKQLMDIKTQNPIYMVNTSCISITKIAALTKTPSRVIGTHFMNPVPLKSAVEVIRGYHTSDETVNETERILSKLKKECIVVNDMPGFVSNRISHLLMNEAAFIVQDQISTPRDIDDIFKKCYGHKMGPLETADLIGLDTVVNSLDILYESFQDSKFRCCPLLRKMVHAGLLGCKSGEGFYLY